MTPKRAWALLPPTFALTVLFLGSCAQAPEAPPTPTPYEPTAEEQAVLQQLSALQAEHNYEEGIATAEAFLAQHPDARRLHYALGIFHGSANKHSQALEEFQRELALDPNHVDSYRGLAAARVGVGDVEAALPLLEKALEIDQENNDVALELGRNLSNLGRFDEAEAYLQRATDGGVAGAATELGTFFRRQNRPEDAAAAFRNALRRDGDDMAAMINLGQLLIVEGRTQEGEALLAKHAQRATLNDQLDLYRRSSQLEGATVGNFLALAELRVRMGQDPEAAAAYGKALELDPKASTAALGLAALYLKTGQAREATKWAVHALMIDPEDAKAHFLLGLLRLSSGQANDAERAFEASRAAEPWTLETWWRNGDAYLSANDPQRAAAAYRQVLAKDPQQTAARYGLGRAEYLLGEPVAALETLAPATRPGQRFQASSDLLTGIIHFNAGRMNDAEQAFTKAATAHRIEMLTGRTFGQLVSDLARLPSTEQALARYQQVVHAGS